MSWERKQLEDVADFTLGKMLDQKKNKGEPLPYLANINVRWGSFDLDDLRQMRFEHHEAERFGLKVGDIVMCEGGEPGRCAIWKDYQPRMMIQKALHRIRPHDGLDNRFLFYTFLHKGKTGGFSPLFTGATIKHLPKEKLAKLEVDIPPLPTQQRIATILTAYDDLIENNRRRIQLLEQAARLLYKEWFVHLRFPGHEHVKVKDGVPDGWEKKKIADICETVGGGTPSTKSSEYWYGDITWVVPSDITKNDCLALFDSERKITEKGLRESSAKMVPTETILMTSRASVGFFALMEYEVCTNQGFINIIPHVDEMRMYLLFNLMSRVEEIRSNAKGTTYPEISKGRFRDMAVVIPTAMLVNEFSGFASDIINQVRILKKSTLKLERSRDLLLPRLMNGEVAV
ncbi:restriction modification system DNA specificity domain-containing protein [Acidithiobacillus ferrivorans SS3]|jgi:type I restriction enzyme S subunit|uniref:Restriction modification system DNA specificity domain-containing protein n=1 Tax=Acidithiobacillus ferrivorans SS3 TaxID=743299 RepID=G0JLB9_9PROT|nr:restriction endonuclease subunit S [Acidithiobacillus ferrivorans]AEM46871.1 restriction modification system DNA specificity domain-containing protein [Acidithiobacillus ferrivorans SS3]OFA16362.1 restriction endonuclease subunit S [Acidithiobacillus ferrivorans]